MLNEGEGKLARIHDDETQAVKGEVSGASREQTAQLKGSPQADAATLVDDAATITEDSWKNIIWREWCRTEDEDYAEYLYELVRTSALGWKFVASLALLFAIGGIILGLFLGAVLTNLSVQAGLLQPTITPAVLSAWGFGLLGSVLGVWSSRAYRTWHYWWQGQPLPAKVEAALREACRLYPEVDHLWGDALHRLTLEKVRHRPVEQLIKELENLDWSYRFAARLALAARGGEAAIALHRIAMNREHPLWDVATGLLTNIEHETRNTYAWRTSDTLCPHCLTQFSAQELKIPLGVDFTFYGCRLCGQSLEHFYVPQGVVALLDNRRSEAHSVQDGLLRINWLTRRELFDFDRVEIVKATDEEVERFAVQVGNDTDEIREKRYSNMDCVISPVCGLSENSLRVLRRVFGVVK